MVFQKESEFLTYRLVFYRKKRILILESGFRSIWKAEAVTNAIPCQRVRSSSIPFHESVYGDDTRRQGQGINTSALLYLLPTLQLDAEEGRFMGLCRENTFLTNLTSGKSTFSTYQCSIGRL
jgi:hypothetical protein